MIVVLLLAINTLRYLRIQSLRNMAFTAELHARGEQALINKIQMNSRETCKTKQKIEIRSKFNALTFPVQNFPCSQKKNIADSAYL